MSKLTRNQSTGDAPPADRDSSGDVLARARDGDREAHALLYARFATEVMTVARRMLGSTSRAEDALQDTFVEVIRGIDRFRDEAALGTWIRRIAINKCLSQIRSRWWVSRVDADAEAIAVGSAGPAIDAAVELERILDRLPDVARVIVWLHDAEGYTHKEIAALLGRTESYSKSQLQRAHRRMRKALADEFDEEIESVCTPEMKTV